MLAICLAIAIGVTALFVFLCIDIRKIRKELVPYKTDVVTLEDVNLAILQGRQEEVYNRIIRWVYEEMMKDAIPYQGINIHFRYEMAGPTAYAVKKAIVLCKKLGKEFPEEMRSFEAFQNFYNI